jgi:iron complex transport system permease protein
MTKPDQQPNRNGKWLLVYAAIFAAAALIAPLFGGLRLHPGQLLAALSADLNAEAEIFLFHRVPRVLLGLLVGGTLAVVGAVFQVVLRNPLAEPFTLGTTGGAALGAVIAISIPGLWHSWGPFSSVQFFALAGAGSALFLIYILARRRTGLAMNTLLLTGVTVSLFCASLVMLVRYLVNPNLLVQMDRWMMGGMDVVGYRELAAMLPLLLPGIGLLFAQANALNHVTLGDEMATGHGIDVRALQRWVFIGGGLATAAAVAMAGPIGFVGLIVPHLVRRLNGYDHRLVLPACFLAGGALLTLCDTAARMIVHPSEMPVGIVTALAGCPVFVWILLRTASGRDG